jgi:hypothetical protein
VNVTTTVVDILGIDVERRLPVESVDDASEL